MAIKAPKMEVKLNCASATIKYILFFFTFLFLVGGITILILGSIILASVNNYGEFFSSPYATPGIILVVTGVVIVLTGFLGCWGAIRQTPWMLIAFACCMMAIFILQITGGILAFVYQDKLDTDLKQEMYRLMDLYPTEEGELARTTWDNLQSDLKCCGVINYGDWQVEVAIETPVSCQCDRDKTDVCNLLGYFKEGCHPKLERTLAATQTAMGVVAIVFAVFELVGVAFALILAHSIRRNALPQYTGRGASNPYNVNRRFS